MEVIQPPNRTEAPRSPYNPGRTPFIRITKNILNRNLPEQVAAGKLLPGEDFHAHLERRTHSFNLVLDEIDRQVYETSEGSSVWTSTSEKNRGVGFLPTNIRIMPELTRQIAKDANIPEQPEGLTSKDPHINERIKHEVCVVFPAYGLPADGSGPSSMDLQIARVLNELPKVANGMTLDVMGVGLLRSLGSQQTQDFVDRVCGTNGKKYEGLAPYAEVYAEYLKAKLFDLSDHYGYSSVEDFLKEARILFEGDALGVMLAGLTNNRLLEIMPEVADRQEVTIFQAEDGKFHEKVVRRGIQRLYINPAGIHGDNPLEQAANSLNMVYGVGIEAALRYFVGAVKTGEFATQPEFYKKFREIKGIPEDSEAQNKLINMLAFRGEPEALGRGKRISEKRRSYTVVSTPDSLHTDLGTAGKILAAGAGELLEKAGDRLFPGRRVEPHQRKVLTAMQKGQAIKFSVGYAGHMYMNLVKGIESGRFNHNMAFVERRRSQQEAT
jgi:hypothetical protein